MRYAPHRTFAPPRRHHAIVFNSLRTAYPESPQRGSGTLDVGCGHRLSWREYGARDGVPALVVHGGPGAACFPSHARWFDPDRYRVVLLDQRGCGASTPLGSLEHNTTDDLVSDIEALRNELGVDAWVLLGGSWGVTLALAYACAHPQAVRGIILRAVCLFRQQEIDWAYRGGAAAIYPGSWQHFKAQVGATRADDDPLALAHALLTGADASARARAAAAWHGLGAALSVPLPADGVQVWRGGPGSAWVKLQQADTLGGTAAVEMARAGDRLHRAVPAEPVSQQSADSPATAASAMTTGEAQAVLEAHYCYHAGFSLADVPLLERVATLRHARIPIVAIHGRCDLLCPVANAYDLHTALPDMELRIVGGAGHSQYNPGIAHELVCATDAFRVL